MLVSHYYVHEAEFQYSKSGNLPVDSYPEHFAILHADVLQASMRSNQ